MLSFDEENSQWKTTIDLSDYDKKKEKIKEEKEEKEDNKIKEEEIKLQNNIILCKKCELIPEIDFINDQYLYITCKCERIKNITFDKFVEEFIVGNENKEPICKTHKKIYESYCKDCFIDKCSECIKETEYSKNHTLLSYDNDEAEKLKSKIENIEKKIKEERIRNSNTTDIINSQGIENKIKNLIKLILILYKKYPCQNLYLTIKKINQFLSKDINNKDLNSIFKVNESLIKRNKSIYYIREFKEIKAKGIDLEIITEIDIQKQNFNKLDIFKGLELPNLKLLRLDENNIQDISPLKYVIFPKLDLLSFARNKINDETSQCIEDFNFSELGVLVLYFNYITNYSIFKTISKFKKLRILFIGDNLFDETTNITKIKDIYDFPNLTQFGATFGVFNDRTISLISNFKFGKLELLYLQGNNLHHLNSFIDKIKIATPDLEELWLSNNYLDEYESISNKNGKFKKLKILNLKNNKINRIDKLKEFIQNNPQLEKIILLGNKINKEDNFNKNLIKDIERNTKVKIEI